MQTKQQHINELAKAIEEANACIILQSNELRESQARVKELESKQLINCNERETQRIEFENLHQQKADADKELRSLQNIEYKLSIQEAKHRQLERENAELDGALQAEKARVMELQQVLITARDHVQGLEESRTTMHGRITTLEAQLVEANAQTQFLQDRVSTLESQKQLEPLSQPSSRATAESEAQLLQRVQRLQV